MKSLRQSLSLAFLIIGLPLFAEDNPWLERGGQVVSLAGALYTVNFVHEGGHWLMAEGLGHEADMEVHPFSGHAEVHSKHRRKRLHDDDRAAIAVAGSVSTRATYELMNLWALDRPHDWATPFLSMTALGLRLDMPFQQLKAGWAKVAGKEHDREDDMTIFYNGLSDGTNARRTWHLIGGVISLADLWTDMDELMAYTSGALGEKPPEYRRERSWFFTADGRNIALDWIKRF
ncbi:MAG: hypothetical protein AB7F75_03760 [Planctomycetota bacterium]